MDRSDFFYDLPQELIAQHPLENRDLSRLMAVGRKSGDVSHHVFKDILDFFNEGDCLVLNNTRVLPARLYGIKEGTGARVEFLLLNQLEQDKWEVITGPGKRAKQGALFTFGEGLMQAEILDVLPDGNRIARFIYNGNFFDILDRIGQMPLPHYITETLEDK